MAIDETRFPEISPDITQTLSSVSLSFGHIVIDSPVFLPSFPSWFFTPLDKQSVLQKGSIQNMACNVLGVKVDHGS